MAQKMIYLNDELYEESKKISNFSDLVSKFFRDYLEQKRSIPELKAEKIAKEEEIKKVIELKQKEVEKIEKDLSNIEKEEQFKVETEEQQKHKHANKVDSIIHNAKDIFDIDITEEQAEKYLKSDYSTLQGFIIKEILNNGENELSERSGQGEENSQ